MQLKATYATIPAFIKYPSAVVLALHPREFYYRIRHFHVYDIQTLQHSLNVHYRKWIVRIILKQKVTIIL